MALGGVKLSDDTKFKFGDGKVITRDRPGLSHARSLARGFLKQRYRKSGFTGLVEVSIEDRHMFRMSIDTEGEILLEESDA